MKKCRYGHEVPSGHTMCSHGHRAHTVDDDDIGPGASAALVPLMVGEALAISGSVSSTSSGGGFSGGGGDFGGGGATGSW